MASLNCPVRPWACLGAAPSDAQGAGGHSVGSGSLRWPPLLEPSLFFQVTGLSCSPPASVHGRSLSVPFACAVTVVFLFHVPPPWPERTSQLSKPMPSCSHVIRVLPSLSALPHPLMPEQRSDRRVGAQRVPEPRHRGPSAHGLGQGCPPGRGRGLRVPGPQTPPGASPASHNLLKV